MKFLSNVLKTLSALDLHAEKKDKFRTVFQRRNESWWRVFLVVTVNLIERVL